MAGVCDVSDLTVGPSDLASLVTCWRSEPKLTVQILGFRPIPLSLSGVRERFLHGPTQAAQPLSTKKSEQFDESRSYPQIEGRHPPRTSVVHSTVPSVCA